MKLLAMFLTCVIIRNFNDRKNDVKLILPLDLHHLSGKDHLDLQENRHELQSQQQLYHATP